MQRKGILIAIVLFAFAASYLGKRTFQKGTRPDSGPLRIVDSQGHAHKAYQRIVSLSPSVTETLFALGMMDHVVGVTRYCDFPPEALTKTTVGGYYDPNYEAIIGLNPDLIILRVEHEGAKQRLKQLGFELLVVDHGSISGILDSIQSIGEACGVARKAMAVVQDLRERMGGIREKTAGLPQTRVMISVERAMGTGSLRDIYIAGRSSFYEEMIALAGGVNAYSGNISFPVVSEEGIIEMDPEVIIDMVTDLDQHGWDKALLLKEWETLSHVDAVENGRVYVFGEDFEVIPGPRFILTLEKMARVIHPEVDWK